MKVDETVIVEIAKIEAKLHDILLELDNAKQGNKAAAQRFRVKSIAVEKEMKQLRKLTIQHG